MKGYIVTSWSPWGCEEIRLKLFFSELDAKYFIKNYTKTRREEDLTIEEVEVDMFSLGDKLKNTLIFLKD